MNTLETQIEEAFHYRGHVTVELEKGDSVVGYLYNREFKDASLAKDQFIQMFLAKTNTPVEYRLNEIKRVTLTGEDHAEGKSYEEWLAKQNKAEL